MFNIETLGRGDSAIVLLHGWGLNREVMRPLAQRLAPHTRVHLLDLPGYGRNAGVAIPTNLVDYSQLVVDAITTLEPHPCHWLGWSLGGLVALQAAASGAPMAQLTLCAASPCFTQRPDWPHALTPTLLEQFASALQQDLAGTVRRFLSLQAQGSERGREEIRQLRDAIAAGGGPNPLALALGLSLLQRQDLRPLLSHITTPVHLIHGARDTLVPIAAQAAIAALLPQATSHTIAGAAHAPFISHPELFLSALRSQTDAT